MRHSLKKILPVLLFACGFTPSAHADFNLINMDLNTPQNQQLSQMYGDAYGFQPQQAAPALLGPSEETPGILKIAQAAGTVPASVWMMRKMGMSYGNILQTFGLGQSTMLGGGLPAMASAPMVPNWMGSNYSSLTDSMLVQSARYTFLRDSLRVNPALIPQIPYRGMEYQRALLTPVLPDHSYWMPPGIAKKYGMWMPPGQAKKYGYDEWAVQEWKPEKKHHNEWHDNDDDDGDHGHGHGHKDHDHGHGHGKGKWK